MALTDEQQEAARARLVRARGFQRASETVFNDVMAMLEADAAPVEPPVEPDPPVVPPVDPEPSDWDVEITWPSHYDKWGRIASPHFVEENREMLGQQGALLEVGIQGGLEVSIEGGGGRNDQLRYIDQGPDMQQGQTAEYEFDIMYVGQPGDRIAGHHIHVGNAAFYPFMLQVQGDDATIDADGRIGIAANFSAIGRSFEEQDTGYYGGVRILANTVYTLRLTMTWHTSTLWTATFEAYSDDERFDSLAFRGTSHTNFRLPVSDADLTPTSAFLNGIAAMRTIEIGDNDTEPNPEGVRHRLTVYRAAWRIR